MPYQRLDRRLEPQLFFLIDLFGMVPGFESSRTQPIYETFYGVYYVNQRLVSEIQVPKPLSISHLLEATRKFYDSLKPETIEYLARSGVKERVSELIALLPDRQQQVMTLSYGLQDGVVRTLKEVAQHIPRKDEGKPTYVPDKPVHTNAVGQIKVKAERKLSRMKETDELRLYLESLAKELAQ